MSHTNDDTCYGILLDVSGSMEKLLTNKATDDLKLNDKNVNRAHAVFDTIFKTLKGNINNDDGDNKYDDNKYNETETVFSLAFGLTDANNQHCDLFGLFEFLLSSYATKKSCVQILRQYNINSNDAHRYIKQKENHSKLYEIIGHEPLIKMATKYGAPYAGKYIKKHLKPEEAGKIFLHFHHRQELIPITVEELPRACKYRAVNVAADQGGNAVIGAGLLAVGVGLLTGGIGSIVVGGLVASAVGGTGVAVNHKTEEEEEIASKEALRKANQRIEAPIYEMIKKPRSRKDIIEIIDRLKKLYSLDSSDDNKQTDDDSVGINKLLKDIKSYIFGGTPMCKSLKYAKRIFELNRDNNQKRRLLIISDGDSTDGEPVTIATNLRNDSNVIIACCFITNEKILNPKQLYHVKNNEWTEGAQTMFEMASIISNSDSKILKKRGWKLRTGQSKLFIQANSPEIIEQFCGIMNNVTHLMSRHIPITAEAADYEFSYQRKRRLAKDVKNIMNTVNNQNWKIKSKKISKDDKKPSVLSVKLKFNILLKLVIDSEYPLKPPKCELDLSKSKQSYVALKKINDDAETSMDQIFEMMTNNVSAEILKKLNVFLTEEEYDSDALKGDVDDIKCCNIGNIVNNHCIQTIRTPHPCIDENNNIILFDNIWSPSLTLSDIVRFCSVIVEGENPTDVVTKYVQMCHNETLNSMLKDGTMKDHLLKYTNPVCKCGAEMVQLDNDKCYGNEYLYVICDGCDTICKQECGDGKEIVYHCPKEKLQNIHPDGYDICFHCVYKNHLRYRQFNALIISPRMVESALSDKVPCKDAAKLLAMFKSLGYHNIITLKDDETTKKNIKSKIDTLFHNDEHCNVNKVNIIVYTGHGNNWNNQFYFDIAGGSLSENELKTWIYGDEQTQNDAIEAMDGYSKCKKAMKNTKTFHRQNTLILINACHSGGFQSLNEMKDKQNKPVILQHIKDEVSKELGVESKNDDEQKQDSLSESIDHGLQRVFNKVSYNTHSALVISSCQKQEESSCFGEVSPFIEYVLDFFKISAQQIIKQNSNEPITSYGQLPDTPIKLYKYIEKRGSTPNEDGISLTNLQQNVTLASERGWKEFVLCPLYQGQ